ncbi:hypothetical protein [Priestia megaterium]|uniref:hypothetical protein n=1 Tax=Priestia megaterium TaxID=1404 RepID=UPI003008D91F
MIQRSVVEGADVGETLDELDSKITDAERLYKRRQREAAIQSVTNAGFSVSKMDVVNAFNTDYRASVQGKVLPDIYDRVELARSLILSAVLDLYNEIDEYRDVTEQVKEIADAAKTTGETSTYHGVQNPVLKNIDFGSNPEIARMIADIPYEANDVIEKRQLPTGVEYTKKINGGKK